MNLIQMTIISTPVIKNSIEEMEQLSLLSTRVQNAILWYNLKKDRMILAHFEGKSFNITVTQVQAPASNVKEAEVDQFCEDLEDLLELIPKKKKMSCSSQGIGMQKQEVKKYLEEQASLALKNKIKQGKGQQNLAKRMHWLQQTPFFNNTRDDFTYGHHEMVNTEIKLITFFVAKDGETVYSQQKQDLELTVAQIISFSQQNSSLN